MNKSSSTRDKTTGRVRTIALPGAGLYYEIPSNIFRAVREQVQKLNDRYI